jgi:predicted alpha/beta-hydrolase family hydrolase
VETHLLPTPIGAARLLVSPAPRPLATVVLGHGASGGPGSPDLLALARALPERGLTVVRVEQPWRVEGRRVAAPPARLDVAWRAVVTELAAEPLIVGGRSAGARVACRTARDLGAIGVVALAFPLQPPGRPDRSRLAELCEAGVPALVLQGERDSFGRPAEFPSDVDLIPVPDADHSFGVPKSSGRKRTEILSGVATAVADWVLARLPA